MSESNYRDRSQEKLERLSEKMDKYHLETLDKLHELSLKVESHEGIARLIRWMVPSGAIGGLIFYFKDQFPHI